MDKSKVIQLSICDSVEEELFQGDLPILTFPTQRKE